ncbi:MAG: LacI family transcriptional regulator [Anaerolineae bacterium]|nr:LacI family transcriptional regulator [Anaerolineae bacterium]
MATIREVARKAGVAAITVSRVINRTGYVSEETRQRVEEAIAELDYVPNVLARGLRSSRTHTLGLLVTDITNGFWTTVARGAEDAAVGNGYSVFLCNTDESATKQEQYLRALLSHRVEGAIIAPASSDRSALTALERARLPFVIVDRRVPGVNADLVLGDSLGGARELVEHLLARGHRRIAHLGGPVGVSTADDRERGYREALMAAGIGVEPGLVQRGDYKLESGRRLMRQLLGCSPLPTAVFAANNVLAVGALAALRERGLRVPEDMALVCFDDLPQASLIDPFLTVAAQPAYELGATAVRLLLERLAHPGRPPETVVLPVQLLIRRSS